MENKYIFCVNIERGHLLQMRINGDSRIKSPAGTMLSKCQGNINDNQGANPLCLNHLQFTWSDKI